MARGDTILQVDTSDAAELFNALKTQLTTAQLKKVMQRSMNRAVQMAKPVIKDEVQKKYKMKQAPIYKAIGRATVNAGSTAGGSLGGVECAIPLKQVRGKMAMTARGNMYKAWGIGSRGQRSRNRKSKYRVHAAVYTASNALLPNTVGTNSQSGGKTAAHFIMSGGRLGGQVWARTGEIRKVPYVSKKTGEIHVHKQQQIRPAVGISIVQMPLNKAAEPIREKLGEKLCERIIHETEVVLGAIQTTKGGVK